MTINDFILKWNDIQPVIGDYKKVDETHILDIYLGKGTNSLKELLIISKTEPVICKSSRAIIIEKGRRDLDGQWATRLLLQLLDEDSVFINLCYDLIESSRKATTDIEALSMFFFRFQKWQKLMEKGINILSEEVVRGLIGEIIYMKNYLIKDLKWDDVISAWLGTEGADKDFVFHETWVEVKSIRPGKNFVTISSLEQLSSDKVGTLAIVEIDNTSSSDVNGFTLVGIIDEVKNLLYNNLNSLNKFESKLIEMGFIENSEYHEKYYVFNQCNQYAVNENFPKIVKGSLPNGILNARYDISLATISAFEIYKV